MGRPTTITLRSRWPFLVSIAFFLSLAWIALAWIALAWISLAWIALAWIALCCDLVYPCWEARSHRGLGAPRFILVLVQELVIPYSQTQLNPGTPFPKILQSFNDILPSLDILYHECPYANDEYKCARVPVPMDYKNPSDERVFEIAFAARKASVSENSPEWSGPFFINPGGPGGSGIELLMTRGKLIHEIVGTTHTLIGFDPRGVNNTTPPTTCFSSNTARSHWSLRSGRAISTDQFDVSQNGNWDIRNAFARSLSLGAACQKMVQKNQSAADYTGTPNVAQDMNQLAEAIWKNAGRLEEWLSGERGLRYWGLSYGSLIGMTYARLFPGRVERMILDGITDMEDYYELGWVRNLFDTDKVIQGFYKSCSKAGPKSCAFSSQEEETPTDIEKRLEDLIEKVTAIPVPVYPDDEHPNVTVPDWVTATDIRSAIFLSLYKPLILFPVLADALFALDHGNAAPLAQFIRPIFPSSIWAPAPKRYTSIRNPNRINTGPESGTAIICSDGPRFVNASLPTLVDYISLISNQSSLTAGNWAYVQLSCAGMSIPARGLERPSLDSTPTHTRNPILFIGNEADPVTPISNARRMRSWFQDAGLVSISGAMGHCSFAVESKCTRSAVRNYVDHGRVDPDEETVCGVERQPFEKVDNNAARDEALWSPSPPGWLL